MATEPEVTIELLKTRPTLLDKWLLVLAVGLFIFRVGDTKEATNGNS